ncbi:hypothetical protein TIFTF001_010424 [Ficus carica]|uniref:Uncharacterized protein n=1 Tax=Ficus carica TaxID=3494 RepID=A0AA88A8N0_FICCA|nr:hypothetical protein TIFTF001_010424 [Ficus carica]
MLRGESINETVSYGILRIGLMSQTRVQRKNSRLCLTYCSLVSAEEDIVDGFPYVAREEYQNMPPLKGEPSNCEYEGQDLVKIRFYNGMKSKEEEKVGSYILLALLQLNADGFVVQTGDPERPAEVLLIPRHREDRDSSIRNHGRSGESTFLLEKR